MLFLHFANRSLPCSKDFIIWLFTTLEILVFLPFFVQGFPEIIELSTFVLFPAFWPIVNLNADIQNDISLWQQFNLYSIKKASLTLSLWAWFENINRTKYVTLMWSYGDKRVIKLVLLFFGQKGLQTSFQGTWSE